MYNFGDSLKSPYWRERNASRDEFSNSEYENKKYDFYSNAAQVMLKRISPIDRIKQSQRERPKSQEELIAESSKVVNKGIEL